MISWFINALFEPILRNKVFMKGFILSIFSSLLLIACCIIAFPQQPQPGKLTQLKTKDIEPAKPVDLSQYADWQKVEMGAYSFYIPKDFKLTKIREADAINWVYKSEDFDFAVIEGPYAPSTYPLPGKVRNFRHKSLLLDGVDAEMGSYEYEGADYKYIRAINFQPPEWKVSSVAIFLQSKDIQGYDLAIKIFNSIRFKDTK